MIKFVEDGKLGPIHFVQRAVNSYQAEVHDTQAASLLLGFSATLTSSSAA